MTDEKLLDEIRLRCRQDFGFVDRVAEVLQQEIQYHAAFSAITEPELTAFRREVSELQFKHFAGDGRLQ